MVSKLNMEILQFREVVDKYFKLKSQSVPILTLIDGKFEFTLTSLAVALTDFSAHAQFQRMLPPLQALTFSMCIAMGLALC